MTDVTMECPYCRETIKQGAFKCRFCGSWLVEGGQDAVDRLSWAETRRPDCERLVEEGDWEAAYAVLAEVAEKAPEAPWAPPLLEKSRERLVADLVKAARKDAEDDPAAAEARARRVLEMSPGHKWAEQFVTTRESQRREKEGADLENAARAAFKAGRPDDAVAACRKARQAHLAGPWAEEILRALGEEPEAASILLEVDRVTVAGDDGWVAALSTGDMVRVLQDGDMIQFPAKATAHAGGVAALRGVGGDLVTSGHDGRVARWDAETLAAGRGTEVDGHPVSLAEVNGSLWVGCLDGHVLAEGEGGLSEVAHVEGGLNSLCSDGDSCWATDDLGRVISVPGLRVEKSLGGAGILVAEGPVVATASGEIHGRRGGSWWTWNAPSSPLAVEPVGAAHVAVAGPFGVVLIGPEGESTLGEGAARGLALREDRLLVARDEGSLEVWNLSRWLGG